MFKNLIGALALVLPFTLSAQNAPAAAPPGAPSPLKVGFVYVSPIGQAGWTFQHEQGRLQMQQALGAQVLSRAVEAVPEGADSERVIRDLAAQGHGLIFATSFGYLEPTLRVAAEFPNAKFEHAGGYKTAPNVNTYNARYYEGRYLAGWLAGKASRSGIAGYVAGFPVPEVIQGINAFALGMRAANPKAQVRVLWLNGWFDPPKEREAALTLIAQGADVLTNHSASPAVAQTAEEKGVRLLGYQSDMRPFAPTAQLASVTHHWGGYYSQVARSVIEGRWQARPVWAGMKDGLVQLSGIDARLPKDVRDGLESRRQALVAGRLLPFAAPLVDNGGRTRLAQGALDDAGIAKMDWFVQGVVAPTPSR